jgi:hypothetical protein
MRKDSPIWAVTAYYNPFRGARRYANYRAFWRNLAIPLVTVEWSPNADFQLEKDDADVLVQVSGGDVMWQKECLLNIAVDHVPLASTYVAWLDCDIIFDDSDWPEKAVALLASHHLVQLFGEVDHLPICDTERINAGIARRHQPTSTRKGIVQEIKSGRPFYEEGPQPGARRRMSGNPGMAFAGHAEWLKRVRFYDAAIVGGGDRMLIAPLLGQLDEVFRERPATPAHERHYRGWLDRLRGLLPMQYAFLPGKIYHLYHGELSDRHYPARPAVLTESGFDPELHICKTPQGVWQWTDEAGKVGARVLAYLESRNDA